MKINRASIAPLLAHFASAKGRKLAASLLGSELAVSVFALAKRCEVSSYQFSRSDELIAKQVIRVVGR